MRASIAMSGGSPNETDVFRASNALARACDWPVDLAAAHLGYTLPMCGRYALEAPRSQLCRRFALAECTDFAARYNMAPASDVPMIRESPDGKRVLHLLRWGLLPHWASDPTIGSRLINARAESVSEKPSFRDAFRRRRCLIPASGFYEWQAVQTAQPRPAKQPWYISLRSGETMAFGGLWESWKSPTGEIIRSCCIVTTEANDLLRGIHERMPLILAPEHWQAWLAAPPDQVGGLLQPYPGGELQAWPVSPRIGKPDADDRQLIAALPGAPL